MTENRHRTRLDGTPVRMTACECPCYECRYGDDHCVDCDEELE